MDSNEGNPKEHITYLKTSMVLDTVLTTNLNGFQMLQFLYLIYSLQEDLRQQNDNLESSIVKRK